MKVYIFNIACLMGYFSLHAQCDSTITIDGQYGTMPPQAYAAQSIQISNSSATAGQNLTYKAGQSIDINGTFDASPSPESNIDMQISQNNYTIGAWYHTSWFLDAYWADRERGYHIGDKDTSVPALKTMPSYKNIADVWNGIRNVALNDNFYLSKIPEMSSEPNYKLAHKPLLNFYDISDKRVMEKQIEMASSRGLSFFGFYNYYNKDGAESGSSRAVKRFKESANNCLMKYMINLYNTDVSTNTNALTITVLDQLASSPGSVTLHSSCLTNEAGRPIIGISASSFMNNNNEADTSDDTAFNGFAQSLRTDVQARFNVLPIILLCSDVSSNGGRAKILMSNPLLYDGYIGFQHLMPSPSQLATNYTNLANGDFMSQPKSINDVLIASLPARILPLYNIPSVSVGFDSRPWLPIPYTGTEYTQYYYSQTNPVAFGKILNGYKTYIDQNAETHKMLMCYAWNEWGESGIIEPSQAYGYQYLDAINSTFNLNKVNDADLSGFSTNYEEWKNSKTWWGLDTDSSYAADPDADGLPNIMEYAFDLNPQEANIYNDINSLPYYNTLYNPSNYWPNCSVPSNCSDPTTPANNLELRYTRDFKKSDLIYFVENSWGHPNDTNSAPSWDLYNDSGWVGHEDDPRWANIITVNGTVETRSCAPHLRCREIIPGNENDYNDKGIIGLRLVIAYLKPNRAINDPIERFVFPPQNKGYFSKMSNTKLTQKNAVIYPNPSKDGSFVINLEDDNKSQLAVTNLIGQNIPFNYSQNGNIIKIDLNGQATGIYIVKVTQNNISHSHKIMID